MFFSFVCSFSNYKMDCYGYLTVCPSHFSPHLSSCELLRSPFVYFLTGFHCFSMYLIVLSLSTAYQCFCHVHQAGGLDCTEQKNKRHWGWLAFLQIRIISWFLKLTHLNSIQFLIKYVFKWHCYSGLLWNVKRDWVPEKSPFGFASCALSWERS